MLLSQEKEELTHKLHSTLAVLPLKDLLTEANTSYVCFDKKLKDVDLEYPCDKKNATVYAKTVGSITDCFIAGRFAPIIVNWDINDHTFHILDGWHRLLAAECMGWETIPCFVLEIPVGEQYVTLTEEEWFVKDGFYDYDSLRGAVCYFTYAEELLRVLK
jgi:hypothetical protein